MKVSTTACIQGAWTPIHPSVKRVVDIGTGTGLLSLMLAQRNASITVDALEIDENTAAQATENIASSPFADRISILQQDARSFIPRQPYDLIICNPPFFSQDLKGPDSNRNAVRHDDHLSASELAEISKRCLSSTGYLSVLWPERRMAEWETIMNTMGWHLHESLSIHHNAGSRVSTVASIWSSQPVVNASKRDLLIYTAQSQYSDEVVDLLKSFYLRL